jgi:hypothetical protein
LGRKTDSPGDEAEKFVDYLDALGKTLTEEEKVARLCWALSDTPKQRLKLLTADAQSTLEKAIEALCNKFDSPQRRELCKRQLAVCKQRDNESLRLPENEKALGPLVKIVNSSLDKIPLK